MNFVTFRMLRRSPLPFLAGLLWIFCISMVGWLSGPEISLSGFHLPAIICVAWFSGRRLATLAAVCAALAWLAADRASSAFYSNPWIPLWNASIRFGFFFITGVLTSEVRTREGVTNSLCHAMAKHIVIAIDNRNKDFELSISDDGTGMDAASAKRRGIGRNIMQYRANLIGGRLDVLSSHGKGTRVLCTVPHAARST